MARILYGIHGTGHGHAMRGLILARSLPQHEFIFVANDDAPKVLEPEFRVLRLPNLGTVFRHYRVDIPATVGRAVGILRHREEHIRTALKYLEETRADVCMCDLEYFVPQAAARAGVPCMALDHQHIITCCRHHLPPALWWDAWLQGLTPRYLFSPGAANVIISFYQLPVLPRYNAMVAPPILRQKTLDLAPRDDGHILVYQSNSTDERLIHFLKTATHRTAHVYGYTDTTYRDGNVVFHRRNEDEFQHLLASCAYVIQGGSHTLMSEALYLGKPIISIPLAAMVEQRFNALYLARGGYGRQAQMAELNRAFLEGFEADLPQYRQNIGQSTFVGNELVFRIVDQYARSGILPDFRDKAP